MHVEKKKKIMLKEAKVNLAEGPWLYELFGLPGVVLIDKDAKQKV